MRELTNEELRKLKEFRDIISIENRKLRKTLWGRINAFFADVDERKELVCDGIELFLTYDMKDLKEVLNE